MLIKSLQKKVWRKHQFEAKEYIVASEVLAEADISKERMNIGVSVDGSWVLRGWTQKQGIVYVCFEDTGKVLYRCYFENFIL